MVYYYIGDGKKFDTNAHQVIYADGHYSSRGVRYYLTREGRIVCEQWSRWQGEHDHAREITVEEFLHDMFLSPHPDRAERAIRIAGLQTRVPDFK